jgi:hypothetical protein
VQEVVNLNPQVFPDGKKKPVAAGTVLLFPELRGLSNAPASWRRAAATRCRRRGKYLLRRSLMPELLPKPRPQ